MPRKEGRNRRVQARKRAKSGGEGLVGMGAGVEEKRRRAEKEI